MVVVGQGELVAVIVRIFERLSRRINAVDGGACPPPGLFLSNSPRSPPPHPPPPFKQAFGSQIKIPPLSNIPAAPGSESSRPEIGGPISRRLYGVGG